MNAGYLRRQVKLQVYLPQRARLSNISTANVLQRTVEDTTKMFINTTKRNETGKPGKYLYSFSYLRINFPKFIAQGKIFFIHKIAKK